LFFYKNKKYSTDSGESKHGKSQTNCRTHFEVRHDELILKNFDFDSFAIHFAINVLPVPGGPKSRRPFGGPRSPLKISLLQRKYFIFIFSSLKIT
jgi:hypothetical protein